jgi:hypothetical protein
VTISDDTASRVITGAEVKGWFGNSCNARLGCAQYGEIAACLTKFRRPSDTPDFPRFPKDAIEARLNRWWDFKAASDAAKTLLDSVPAMASHWDGLRWAPETCGGYEAIKTLGDALVIALPYIEWPFGHYQRQTGRKRPKAWHIPAVLIAHVIVKAMIGAGHNEPGITRNSVVVRVVHKALIRMRFPDSEMITATAIGAHLTRWDEKFGLTPKGIGALTTK